MVNAISKIQPHPLIMTPIIGGLALQTGPGYTGHTAADSMEIILLIGLDLSAAFDMVCHSTLTPAAHRVRSV